MEVVDHGLTQKLADIISRLSENAVVLFNDQ
jgi:hypothetical protein